MSDYMSSACNFCIYRAMVRNTTKNQRVTRIARATAQFPGGVDIFRYPKDVNILTLSADERRIYWLCWFAELPNKCSC